MNNISVEGKTQKGVTGEKIVFPCACRLLAKEKIY